MKKFASLALFSFLLIACNSNENKSEELETDFDSYNCSKEYQNKYSSFLSLEDMLSTYKVPYVIKEEEESGENGKYLLHWTDEEGVDYEMGIKSIVYYERAMDSIEIRQKFDDKYKRKYEQLMNVLSDKKEESSKPRRTWVRISDLGDQAWFDHKEGEGGELEVLAGRMKFIVKTNLGNNRDLNLKTAIILGQRALEKCQ